MSRTPSPFSSPRQQTLANRPITMGTSPVGSPTAPIVWGSSAAGSPQASPFMSRVATPNHVSDPQSLATRRLSMESSSIGSPTDSIAWGSSTAGSPQSPRASPRAASQSQTPVTLTVGTPVQFSTGLPRLSAQPQTSLQQRTSSVGAPTDPIVWGSSATSSPTVSMGTARASPRGLTPAQYATAAMPVRQSSPRGSPTANSVSQFFAGPSALRASPGADDEQITIYTASFGYQAGEFFIQSIRYGLPTDVQSERIFYVKGGKQPRGREAFLVIAPPSRDGQYDYGRVYPDEESILADFRNRDFRDRKDLLDSPLISYSEDHDENQLRLLIRGAGDPENRLVIQRITFP